MKHNYDFCRIMLRNLRVDLKRNKIKLPKITHLGVYFIIGNENIEIENYECNYSKRWKAILKYLDIKGITLKR